MVERKKLMTWKQQGKEVGKESLQSLVELYVLGQLGSMGSVPLLR